MGRLLITTHDCYSTREADETASLRVATPVRSPTTRTSPPVGRSRTTAFRLSGIRARGDAAESDVAMASNDNKKKARWLQKANPGMKYTEALRLAQETPPSGHIQMLDEWALIARAGTDTPSPHIEWDPKTGVVALHESYHMRPREKSAGAVERMARLARRGGHDEKPTVPVQRLSDIIDRLDTGGRAPWPLQVGNDLSDWTPAVLYPLETSGNLAVVGNALNGHTNTLRHLVNGAVSQGWVITAMGPKGDEFRDLCERHPGKVTALSCGRFITEEEREAFLREARPGTASEPRLLVIDNGSYLFEGADEGEEWVDGLEWLMAHPHTAVVLQITRLSPLPARLRQRLNARLLLGHTPKAMQASVFEDVVPRELFDSLDFSSQAGSPLGRGRGVLWDGERLQHVRIPDESGQEPLEG